MVPSSHNRGKTAKSRRLSFLVNQRFQWKYTWYLVVTIMIATFLTGGVTAYFLNQNYGIFTRLAQHHAADLLPQLEREQLWINSFLVAFFITLVSFNLIYGLRMTSRIAGPMMVLKRHIRSLCNGFFFGPILRVRESDEFKDIIDSYNYLYQSLRAQIKRDIKIISEAIDDNDKRKANQILEQLLDEKKAQLDIQTQISGDRDESSEPTPSERHVS